MFTLTFPARVALAALAGAMTVVAPHAAADPGQQGMAVVRDPQTGQLRVPTAAELRALREADSKTRQMRPQAAAQPPVVRPDGVRAATLGERGMVYSVVRRGADGRLSQQCVEGEAAAAHAAHQGATPPQGKEHNHE